MRPDDGTSGGFNPPPLRPDQLAPETPVRTDSEGWQILDVDWLKASGFAELRQGDGAGAADVMVRLHTGVYVPLLRGQQSYSRAALLDALRAGAPHRVSPDPADMPPVTARHYQQVIGKLLDEQSRLPIFQRSEYNAGQVGTGTVLPLHSKDGGGAYRVRDGQPLSPDEVAPLRVSCAWTLPAGFLADIQMSDAECDGDWNDPGVRLLAEFLTGDNHPLVALAEMAAYGLVDTPKGVGLFIWDAANTMKSTMAGALVSAFGAAMHHTPATKSLASANGFTPAFKPLAVSLTCFYDEAGEDKAGRIPAGDLELMVARLVLIHEKYVEPGWETRTGFAVLMGNKWPALPFGTTGLVGNDNAPARGDFAPVLVDETPGVYPGVRKSYGRREHRAIMDSPAAMRYLRRWVCRKAQDYAAALDAGTADGFYDVCGTLTRELIDAGRAEIRQRHSEGIEKAQGASDFNAAALDALTWTGLHRDLLPVGVLNDALGVDRIDRKVRSAWQQAFSALPDSVFKSVTRNRKKVYQGWRLAGYDTPKQGALDGDTAEQPETLCADCGAPIVGGACDACNLV